MLENRGICRKDNLRKRDSGASRGKNGDIVSGCARTIGPGGSITNRSNSRVHLRPPEGSSAVKPLPPEVIPCLVSMTEQRIQELDANQLPSFPASTAFADARRHLTALGWRPVTLATARPCRPGDVSCRSDLEMVVCSGGFPATCRHTWMRHGTIIEITTQSGEKSEVKSVICRAGC